MPNYTKHKDDVAVDRANKALFEGDYKLAEKHANAITNKQRKIDYLNLIARKRLWDNVK